ncbi:MULTISPECIES: hypothetical protein [Enterobacterales]|uniref:hypothetical protein n=1 Tax=Enterobacterales TaxID=91347 RepID=UPI002ED895DE
MKNKTIYAVVSPSISIAQWLSLCEKWDSEPDITMDTSLINSSEEIMHVAKLAFLTKNRFFSLSVMSNLAEKELISNELLDTIFDIGDQACKETVCLRKNLSKELDRKCKSVPLTHHYKKNKEL